ncbi:MAG: hypothetical protein D6758_12615 [Gammaproteobacteria bacterium]|nr:MAG: hypothetical protein D6758_12615 [Gammaproteobacteria bacterium]
MLDLIRNAPWVSLTGLYTGHVWAIHGLTPKGATTWLGRCVRWGLMPAEQMMEAFYGVSLEKLLVGRHQCMDRFARSWAETHRHLNAGFLELPCGLASRARRMAMEFTDPTMRWMEGDLPHVMRARLEILGKHDRVESLACNALRWHGTESLEVVAKKLRGCEAVCVSMEGLLNYFDCEGIRTLLTGQARLFKNGSLTLFADVWPDSDSHPLGRSRQIPARVLSRVTHSKAGLRGRSVGEIAGWFLDAGFDRASVHDLDGQPLEDLGQTRLPPCVIVKAEKHSCSMAT